jgi:DNA-binding transcriptional ArsR family regulator
MSIGETFAALADPTRRAVVERLARGDATVGVLAAPHAMSLPAFSKHVRVLVEAGLVRRRKVGRAVVCSLDPASLDEVAAWVADTTAFWRATLDRLEQVLDEVPSEEGP